MKNSIQQQKPKDSQSYWITPDASEKFSVASTPIEIEETESLVEAILAEFNNTDELLIPEMRIKLNNWLSTMTEEDLELINSEKIRDFIYEMF